MDPLDTNQETNQNADMANEVPEATGAFQQSLIRTNKQIKESRAREISEDVETVYRRKVEDLGIKIKRMKQTQAASLDFSPESAGVLKFSNVDSESFSENDLKACRDIRDLEITYELAKARYHFLFGKQIAI